MQLEGGERAREQGEGKTQGRAWCVRALASHVKDVELFLKKDFIYLFLERREGRERRRERNIDVRGTLISCLLYVRQPGTRPVTQARALTGT